MHVHIRYGSEKEEYVMVFNNVNVSVEDVLHRVKKRYGKKTRLRLIDEYNISLKKSQLVEKGRSYRVKR